jgi:uncharacterized delta-60 repeat protein
MEPSMRPVHPALDARTRALAPALSTGLVRLVLGLLLVAVLLTWQLAAAAPARAKAGDLDPSFGTGGKVTTDLTGSEDNANGLVIQPDGKLVAAGGAGPGTSRDFGLARYRRNGTLDPSFGTGGLVTTDFFGFTDAAQALVRQPDGKLVAAGAAFSTDTFNFDFALARYHPNGTLDASFGTGGKVTTDLTGGGEDVAFALALQADGNLVAAGGRGGDFALTRYHTDGTLDTSFGTGGKVTTDFVGGDDIVFALAVRPHGKLVAAGRAFTGASEDYALARYQPNGTPDPTFGSGGKVTTDFNGGFDQALDLVVQTDGKLVTAGQVGAPTVEDFGLARYRA